MYILLLLHKQIASWEYFDSMYEQLTVVMSE